MLIISPIDCTFCDRVPMKKSMSFFEQSLVGKQIDSVHVDSEVTYVMLSDGTQVTIRGWVLVAPGVPSRALELPAPAIGPGSAVRGARPS